MTISSEASYFSLSIFKNALPNVPYPCHMPSVIIPETTYESLLSEFGSVEEEYDYLHKTLTQYPSLLHSIRHLRFSRLDEYVQSARIFPLLNQLWLAGKNIETVEFSFGGIEWDLLSPSVKIAFENLLLDLNLKSLTIRNVKNFPPKLMAICIRSRPFVVLESVSFQFCNVENDEPSSLSKRSYIPPGISDARTLKIADVSLESVMVLNTASAEYSYQLDTLIAGPQDRPYSRTDIGALQEIVYGNPDIKTLDLLEVTSCKYLDLSTLPMIQTLKLRVDDYDGDWQHVACILHTVSDENNLTQLVIQINFDRFPSLSPWKLPLDKMLATKPKFLNLRNVVLLIDRTNRGMMHDKMYHSRNSVVAAVKNAFPKMSMRCKMIWRDTYDIFDD